MADQPTDEKKEPKKSSDYVMTEIKAMNQILAAFRRIPLHRRGPVMKYITDLFEQAGTRFE